MRLKPVYDRFDSVNVLILDIVLFTKLCRDVDVRDVVTRRGVDTVQRI